MNLPEAFLERLKRIITTDKYDAVLESFCTKKPTTFRANTVKISASDLIKKLQPQGFEVEAVDWYKDAFILKNKSQRELTETDSYKTGELYIQGLSSMIPPLVLNPQTSESILDACAAPGSKTTQISSLMNATGEIIANDRSRVRLYKLAANIKLQGATNVRTIYFPAQVLWEKFPQYFDRALVDVPCSLEGGFQCDYPKSYGSWSVKKVKQLAEYQKKILRSAIAATKPGGTIVYSTCTLSPEENEGVIDWILKKESGSVSLAPIDISVETAPAVLEWNGKTYNPEVEKTVRVLPSNLMEGFFLAKFIKNA